MNDPSNLAPEKRSLRAHLKRCLITEDNPTASSLKEEHPSGCESHGASLMNNGSGIFDPNVPTLVIKTEEDDSDVLDKKVTVKEEPPDVRLPGGNDTCPVPLSIRIKTEPIDMDYSDNGLADELKGTERGRCDSVHSGQEVPIKAEPQYVSPPLYSSSMKVESEDNTTFPVKSEPVDSTPTSRTPIIKQENQVDEIPPSAHPCQHCSIPPKTDVCCCPKTEVKQEPNVAEARFSEDVSVGKLALKTETNPTNGSTAGAHGPESVSNANPNAEDLTLARTGPGSKTIPTTRAERNAKKIAQLNLRADDDETFEPKKKVQRLHDNIVRKQVWGNQPKSDELSSYNGVKLKPCFVKVSTIPNEVLVKHGLPDPTEKKVDLETLHRGLFSCQQCSFRSHFIKELRRHEWIHRKDDYYGCPECDFKAIYQSKRDSHVRIVHRKKKLFRCYYCSYPTENLKTLKRHIEANRCQVEYICKSCGTKLKSDFLLKQHMRTHTGDRPYACPHCPYRAKQYSHIKSHCLRHLNLKPFACDKCEYKCNQKTHLNTHTRIAHSNERPFKCNLCDYAAKCKPVLEIHIRSRHTREQPFSCKHCSFKTAHPTMLYGHLKGHSKQLRFKCPVCSWSTDKYRWPLHRHIMLCHPEVIKYQCFYCKFQAILKKPLRSHIKRKHNLNLQRIDMPI